MNQSTPDSKYSGPEAAERTLPIPRSALRHAFFGGEGLRAGWSLLIFISLIAGSFYLVHLGRKAIRSHPAAPVSKTSAGKDATSQSVDDESHPGPAEASKELPPREAFLGEGPYLLMVLLVTLAMSRVEGRPFGTFGLGGTRRLTQLLTGAFWGVLCLSTLVGLLRLFGFLRFDAILLRGVAALRYGILWAAGFLLVAFLEETLLRGYAQYTLARGLAAIYGLLFRKTRHRHALGFWTAALILSFVFGIGHSSNPGESPVGLLGAGLAGLVFCFALYRTGSLWWTIGLHAGWDWSQSFLYGVADSGNMAEGHLLATHPLGKPILSGGLTGPEGSIFAILMLAVLAGIIFVTLRPTRITNPDA